MEDLEAAHGDWFKLRNPERRRRKTRLIKCYFIISQNWTFQIFPWLEFTDSHSLDFITPGKIGHICPALNILGV